MCVLSCYQLILFPSAGKSERYIHVSVESLLANIFCFVLQKRFSHKMLLFCFLFFVSICDVLAVISVLIESLFDPYEKHVISSM